MNAVYPDNHDMWIDPKNPNRLIVANDRYVNLSTNRGATWLRTPLPIAQMYHVATDNRIPYYVFGNRQDGPAHRGPSNSLSGTQILPGRLDMDGRIRERLHLRRSGRSKHGLDDGAGRLPAALRSAHRPRA